MVNSQNPHSQIENDQTPGIEYPNGNDSGVAETKKASIPNFMFKLSTDDQITEGRIP